MRILSELRRGAVDTLLGIPVFLLWCIDEYTHYRTLGPHLARFGEFAVWLRGGPE